MHGTLFKQLTVKQADHYSLPLVKQFYKKNGMRAQAPKGEKIYVVTLDSRIIAALRLSPIGTNHLLRSMCVASDLRKQGIGSYLLEQIQSELVNLNCYCFPYTHLESFYGSSGFVALEVESAPEAIQDKFLRYINNGKNICLMKHQRSMIE